MRNLICSRGEASELSYIPELIARNIAVELQGYGLKGVRSVEDWQQTFDRHRRFRDKYPGYLAVHGPFIGVNYCHDDHLLRDAVKKRLDQTFDVVRQLEADRLILHSGFHSDVPKFEIYDDWINLTAEFWRKEVTRYEQLGVQVVLENIVDATPDFLCRVHDKVDSPSLKLCLDTGHVNVWASSAMDTWINVLESRIHHVHVHNNNGRSDQHLSLDQGTLNLRENLCRISKVIPHADLSFEILGNAGYLMEVIENIAIKVD